MYKDFECRIGAGIDEVDKRCSPPPILLAILSPHARGSVQFRSASANQDSAVTLPPVLPLEVFGKVFGDVRSLSVGDGNICLHVTVQTKKSCPIFFFSKSDVSFYKPLYEVPPFA